jgi:hypothetical protein
MLWKTAANPAHPVAEAHHRRRPVRPARRPCRDVRPGDRTRAPRKPATGCSPGHRRSEPGSCAAHGRTRSIAHQPDDSAPLTIDLARRLDTHRRGIYT